MKRLYHYPSMVILSVLSVVMLVIFEVSLFFDQVLLKPEIYSETLAKNKIADVIYDDLCEYFEYFSAPTNIPSEVFTEPLDKKQISDAVYNIVSDSLNYLTDSSAPKPQINYDFTPLEESITNYVETYSDANGIEKNDEYYDLLNNTIKVAEQQVTDRFDVILLYRLSDSGVAAKAHKYLGMLSFIIIGSGAMLLICIVLMCVINRHHPRDMSYWFGSILFCSAALLLVPTVHWQKTRYFDGFFVKSEYVYKTVTGLFNNVLDRVVDFQIVLLIIGILLIILTVIIHMIYINYREKRSRRAHS